MSYGDRKSAGSLVKGRNSATTTALKELIAAPGPSSKLMISTCTIVNRSATPTAVNLLSGTTVIYTFPAPSTYGGVALPFPDPLDCAVNEALNFQAEDAADLTVSVNGFRNPV